MFKLFAPLVFAAATLAGAPAFAGQTSAPVARVSVADLDLGTPAGVDRFDRRLAAAIRRVCPGSATSSLRTVYNYRACVRAASLTASEGRARVLAQAAGRTEFAASGR